jgi:hypothetical protein
MISAGEKKKGTYQLIFVSRLWRVGSRMKEKRAKRHREIASHDSQLNDDDKEYLQGVVATEITMIGFHRKKWDI